jgi:outer membrane protein OmpA-like peptidoglycan-associated protein
VRGRQLLVVALATSALTACATSTDTNPPPVNTTRAPFPDVEGVGDLGALDKAVDKRIEVAAAISEHLETEGVKGSVIIEPEECTLKLTFPEKAVQFAYNSAELTPESGKTIASAAPEFEGAPQIVVTGHSSSEGDPNYNVDLSRRRAESVAAVLASLLPDSHIETAGVGSAEPEATPELTEADRSQNRRVVLTADVERPECGVPPQ